MSKSKVIFMPHAEDAEYTGSTVCFCIKPFNQERFFEPEPECKFKVLLEMAKNIGCELSTPSEVIASAKEITPDTLIGNIENGAAWHGGTTLGRSNIRKNIDDLFAANKLPGKTMDKYGIGNQRAVYSSSLMETQIKLIEKQLMDQRYFGA